MQENKAVTYMNPARKAHTVTVLVFALFILSGMAYYILQTRNTASEIKKVVAPNETYLGLKNNPDFLTARQAFIEGKYSEAIDLFKKITPRTNAENSYLQFEIAANMLTLDGPRGIEAFSNLVASSSINNENKAYALVSLTNYYSLNLSTSTLRLIQLSSDSWGDVVSEDNLKILRTTSKPDDARIALTEMSVSLYQTSGAHVWLGYLYARKAQEVSSTNKSVESRELSKKYAEKARNNLAISDTDPDKIRESENLKVTIPTVLLRKAMALAVLEKLGETKENPAEAFEYAIERAIQERTIVPFFYYNYALYLISKQNPDEEKIRSVLVEIIKMKDHRAFPVMQNYISSLIMNTGASEAEAVKKLFIISPPFKKSLGY